MKRAPLYSSSRHGRARGEPPRPAAASAAPVVPDAAAPAALPAGWRGKVRGFARRRRAPLLFLGGLLCALVPALAFWLTRPVPQEMTQEEIDSAVLHTLENESLPSRSARAAEMVRQSVVRVRGYGEPADPKSGKPGKNTARDKKKTDAPKSAQAQPDARDSGKADGNAPAKGGARNGNKGDGKGDSNGNELEEESVSTGTGVVILDKGVILTNLHVVRGAKRLTVTFFDGLESEAEIIGTVPENDMAVLQAKTIPDDLPAATLGSSSRLKPGDEVVAVGFPFGIGPSVSSGVVSGLNREFRSPEGKQVLTHLIQFDAAANSGNSGGPLVTMDGEVVGIVTAILNPSGVRTFIGIGFAVTIEGAGSAVGIPPF